MKITTKFPPNYIEISTVFRNHEQYSPVFAWGDTVYNPFNADLTPDVLYHEAVHTAQQGEDIVGWYNKYLYDPEFRLSQELEAYAKQYKFVSKYIKDRELVNHLLNNYAEALSSPLYGSLVTKVEARKLIKNYE
jgi:hypothetical protein